MDYLDNIHRQKKAAHYKWQQKALDMWQKINATGRPNSSYFKCFKENETKATEAAYFASDSNSANPLMTFFWRYNNVDD